jgi:hypothetical protein
VTILGVVGARIHTANAPPPHKTNGESYEAMRQYGTKNKYYADAAYAGGAAVEAIYCEVPCGEYGGSRLRPLRSLQR